jgi:hypothetical protein
MFNLAAMYALVNAKPFVPFRLHLSDGGSVVVRSRELVLVGKQFAVIGLLDPGNNDLAADLWTTVWYLHVTRHEMLQPSQPPFMAPPSSGSEQPTPVTS